MRRARRRDRARRRGARRRGARAQHLRRGPDHDGRLGERRARRCARRWASREELSESYDTTRAYVNLCVCLDKQGRLEEAAELALEGERVAERVGVRTHARFLAGDACWRLTRLGRLDEAEPIAERAVAAAPKGMAGVLVFDAAGHLAMRRGRLDEAAEHFAMRARAAQPDARFELDRQHGLRPGRGRALALRSRGRAADCRRARWTSSPAASTSSPPCASTPPRCGRVADCALRALALGDERRADEAQRDARATLERLRALLAADRWPQGTAGPEPVAFEAVCVAELSRAGGDSDPDGLGRRGGALRGAGDAVRAGLRPLAPGRGADRRGGDRTAAADAAARGGRDRRDPARAAAGGRGRGAGEARARRPLGRGGRRRARDPAARASSGSPSASAPSSRWWPRATPTARSARRSSSPRRPPASTSRGSWPSSACARAWRRPRPPTASVSCEAAHAPRAAPPGGDNRRRANTRLEPRVRRPRGGARPPRGGARPGQRRHGGRRVRGRRVGRRQDAAAARARAPSRSGRGARVLRGDCLAFGADGLPYAPIAAALRGLRASSSRRPSTELVGPAAR